jgi:hypothetical protein
VFEGCSEQKPALFLQGCKSVDMFVKARGSIWVDEHFAAVQKERQRPVSSPAKEET